METVKTVSGEAPRSQKRRLRLSMLPFDASLLIAVLGLAACSLISIKGSTANDIPNDPLFFFVRQSVHVVIGVLVMVAVSRVSLDRLFSLRKPIYAVLVLSNLAVFALAEATRGTQRWIDLPFFRFQPSELGKVLLVVAVAAFAVERARTIDQPKSVSYVGMLVAIPAAIVMAQPDLGTALVYGVSGLAVLFLVGVSWRYIGMIVAGVVASAVAVLGVLPKVGVHVLKPYQMSRLTSFVSPSSDPSNDAYQLMQSKIAIGSGEKIGRGVNEATQTALNFLPEHHTDFIFAVIGETYGFAGAALVLSLYALLIWRGLHILTFAKDQYSALIAGGISAMFLFQIFVNIGMTIGIMPITGIPAPFLSFGGASLQVSFMAVGLLQAVHLRARRNRRHVLPNI